MSQTSHNSQSSNEVKCPYCDRSFKSRGLKKHVSCAHPDAYRQTVLDELHPAISSSPHDSDQDNENEVVALNSDFDSLIQQFDDLLAPNIPNHEMFEACCNKFSSVLKKCEFAIPGPKNPARKFYEIRKNGTCFKNSDSGHSTSTNPERASKRKRIARKAQYKENMIQFLFYNQRKKAVRLIMDTDNKSCNIPMEQLERDFNTQWSTPNNAIGQCLSATSDEQQNKIDAEFSPIISPCQVKQQIKRMNVDSAPGPDGIMVRWVKCTLKKSKIILASIITYMLQFNFVPAFMREAKTILIYKSGDPNSSKNWRPITITSVLRRICEKVLDKELRQFVQLSHNQRGFTNQAGTLINTQLINECLKKAKKEKLDCTVIFGDILQAFDNVGHAHMFNQINSKPVPTFLKNICCNLAANNYTRINTKSGKSGIIKFERGVMQGGPLSSFMFNITINPMVQDLSEKEVTEKFGFSLHRLHDNISNAEFADDTGLIGNSRNSAIELYQQSAASLAQFGLTMNPLKSVAISIVKGELCQDPLHVSPNTNISCIGPDETIKYLGVSFNDCIVFDESKCANKFNAKVERLVSTQMLRPDQKLKVLKDYLWPTLTYPFQHAPLTKLSVKFLDSIDKIIRSAAKEILMLPSSTPSSMLYSSHKVKGLSLIRARWEAGIQNYNSAEILLKSGEELLNEAHNYLADQTNCLDFLDVPTDIRFKLEVNRTTQLQNKYIVKKSKVIRDYLRQIEYDSWCQLHQKGQGVIQFQECPQANKWIHSKNGLSSSEWINAIKMNAYVLPVKAIPRPDLGGDLYCRFGCRETETLGHILGKCRRGELLRNNRHHAVRRLIADAMSKVGWKVLQEIECSAYGNIEDPNSEEPGDNSNTVTASRRVDIIAYNPSSKKGLILDPTVRMEQDAGQAEAVNLEKKSIYNPCIPYFKDKLGLVDIQVIGLYVGARGTISKFFVDFLKHQGIPSMLIEDIVTTVLKKSVQICIHHLFSSSIPNT